MRARQPATEPLRVAKTIVNRVRRIAKAEKRTVRCVAEAALEGGLNDRQNEASR